jgi:hypothetical protein
MPPSFLSIFTAAVVSEGWYLVAKEVIIFITKWTMRRTDHYAD